MSGINTGRVLQGGFLAGLVITIGEFVSNLLFGDQFNAALETLGRPPIGGGAIAALSVVLLFALGVLMVWLYAGLRPRFGAGPRTAIITGLVVWVLFSAFPTVGYAVLDLFPTNLLVIGLAWTLVETLLATVAGAWFYRE